MKGFTPYDNGDSNLLGNSMFKSIDKTLAHNITTNKSGDKLSCPNRRCSTGFTLLETLIIFGVLALLSTAMLTSLHVGEYQIVLLREQAKIIGVLSRAKSLSVATFGQGGVPCGFGVHFEAPNFLLFKDLAVDCRNTDRKYSGPNEIYESFQLDSRIIFDTLTLSDVVFFPPDPTVIITPNQDEATIILKAANGSNSASIKINSAGQIST